MKLSLWSGMALVIGGVALGGVVSAVAQEDGSTQRPRMHPGHGGRMIGMHHGVVRSQAIVEGDDGEFLTVRMDRGVLRNVDGTTLTIEEADGQTVRVSTTEDTRVWRDREEAAIGDLEEGDHVVTRRTKEGDAEFVTTAVKAVSAERYAEFEERREACRSDGDHCRRRGGYHRGSTGAERSGRSWTRI